MNHYGYYLFLGLGDFPEPASLDHGWTSTWDLEHWRDAINRLKELGTNTLFVYLMGHDLPYSSRAFPDCVEVGHPNVEHDFLQQVLDFAAVESIEVVAVFSTTGHAKTFAARNPRLAISGPDGVPMPQHGILCHHKADAQAYPCSVIAECLTRYKGFSGVVLHPPEFVMPCYCDDCCAAFAGEGGGKLRQVSKIDAQLFFMQGYMHFQDTVLEALLQGHVPDAKRFTFTIPWIFEQGFEKFAQHIDSKTVIVDWDYDLREERIAQLPDRLERYRQFGHELWFMPTAGFDFKPELLEHEQSERVLRQIQLAQPAGIEDIIYFLGPYWYPTIRSTSWFLERP